MQTIIALIVALSVIIISVMVHEMGHTFASMLVGIPIKAVHLGLPLPPETKINIPKIGTISLRPLFQKKIRIGNLDFIIQPWIFGGGLEIDKDNSQLSYPNQAFIAVMGPVFNAMLLVGLTYFYLGPRLGIEILSSFIKISAQGTILIASGQSTIEIKDLIGPVGLVTLLAQYIQLDFHTGTAVSMIVLNYAMLVTNLLPLPVLDGGYIFLSPLWKFNKSLESAGEKLSSIFFYLFLVLVVILTIKDIHTLVLQFFI